VRVDGAVEHYRRFKPADATESALALVAVGLTNASMDGLERANRDGLASEVRFHILFINRRYGERLNEILQRRHTFDEG
jgi:hypothetical protein